MSVINQMLRDLDKRGASRGGADASNFAAKRQAVEARRVGSDWFWRTSAFLALVAVAWVGWLIWELRPRSLVMEVALRKPVPVARTATRDMPRDESQMDAPPANEARSSSPPVSPIQEAKTSANRLERGGLKLAMEIAAPPTAAPKATVPESKAKASESSAVAPAQRAAPPGPIATTPAREANSSMARRVEPLAPREAAAPAPRIEKREVSNAMERAEAEYRAALAALAQSRVARAAEGFRQTLAYDAAHEGARQALVGIYVQDRRFDPAAALLNEGLAVNPRNLEFAMGLARITVERGDAAGALGVLDRYASTLPLPADYRAFRAALQQRLGRHRDAVEEYRVALAQSPGMGQWWVGLGISQQAQSLEPEALESFRRAKAAGNITADLMAFVDQRIRQLQR